MSDQVDKHFDPSEKIRGIQQLLVSDKKKIAFLFGAGTSLARRNDKAPYIPAIAEMTKRIEEEIAKNKKYATALGEIKIELGAYPQGFNVETLLSNIEDKMRIIGSGKLNKLSRNDFEGLANLIKVEILKIVSIHKQFNETDKKQLAQYDFAKWIKNAGKKYAVEMFTTNYDYLFEIGLEAVDVPYYDGFTGSYEPFFDADSLEDIISPSKRNCGKFTALLVCMRAIPLPRPKLFGRVQIRRIY